MDLSNQFLIAMPALGDPNFERTVTYIYSHDADGALGLVINRPLDIQFGELLDHLDITATTPAALETPVVFGGPVELERGFVLHEPGQPWDALIEVENGLAVSASRTVIEAIATGNGPPRAMVALGYAGWGAGQLESEVLDNAWLSGPASLDIVFDVPFEQRWEQAARLMGVDVERLSSQTGHS